MKLNVFTTVIISDCSIMSLGVGVVLASYTWGRDAQRHVGMTDEDLIEECIKSLAKVHNMDYDTVRNMYLKGVVKKWDLDEFTLGAFTVFEPYQVSWQIEFYVQQEIKPCVLVFRN